jgi:hypothetical protein
VYLIVFGGLLFVCRIAYEWLTFEFDFPAQDCLMNSWQVSGEVKDQHGSPVPNARIDITGANLLCDNNIHFQPIMTDAQGKFDVWQIIYSPMVDRADKLDPTEVYRLRLPSGTYEIKVTAAGYDTYTKRDATDDEVFQALILVLNKQK